ncbi:MAG: hypothetical protein ACPL7B_15020 [Candidatus Poribacteria bacterium]
MRALEDRVINLEEILADFITNTESALNRLSIEVQKFKEEGEAERRAIREEMKAADERLERYIKEMKADRKAINKQWGELANKMGTLVEDLISPASGPVIEKYFGCKYLYKTERCRKRFKDGRDFEVDVLVVCEDKVFMIEVKSNPEQKDVNEIIKKSSKFMDFFPEYEGKELIPIFASLVFNNNLIKYASKKGLYLMAYREWDYMDIVNFDMVKRTQ